MSTDQLRDLEAAATPGPWFDRYDGVTVKAGYAFQGYTADETRRVLFNATPTMPDNTPADAVFIAAFRNVARELLDVVDAARKYNAVAYHDVGWYEGATPEFSCIKTEDANRIEPLAERLNDTLAALDAKMKP